LYGNNKRLASNNRRFPVGASQVEVCVETNAGWGRLLSNLRVFGSPYFSDLSVAV